MGFPRDLRVIRPNVRYITVGFFTDYRNQAWHYYSTNETTYESCLQAQISLAGRRFHCFEGYEYDKICHAEIVYLSTAKFI